VVEAVPKLQIGDDFNEINYVFKNLYVRTSGICMLQAQISRVTRDIPFSRHI
jgi:hypothetical protein